MLKIDLVVAARPNFMKVAPLYRELRAKAPWCRPRLVHTGQHYDHNMSGAFFKDLGLPDPDIHLGVGGGSHSQQTAGVMIEYEKACIADRPDWVVVVGDVNSTVACTLAAKKLGISVAHLEAGLRSGDRTMPEELNRVVTDSIADLLWTPTEDADENLKREGVPEHRIHRVGNIMIDSFELMRGEIERRQWHAELGLSKGMFCVMTLHRPSNVDDADRLAMMSRMVARMGSRLPVVFPLHPRTRQRLTEAGLLESLHRCAGVRLVDPAPYIEFMSLVSNAACVVTDSGGVQEETTYLGVPCMTLRENTERPVTITQGTNRLVKLDEVDAKLDEVLGGKWPKGSVPPLWDGQTARRVAASLARAAGI